MIMDRATVLLDRVGSLCVHKLMSCDAGGPATGVEKRGRTRQYEVETDPVLAY